MTLYLVRHAKAGQRSAWEGDDRRRPLSPAGWEQAKLLGERLAVLGPSELVSSPYLRCVQTLEPLADLVAAAVRVDERLAEEQPFEPVLDLLAALPDASVLCSHGDLIPDTVAALERRGLDVRSDPDWRKASVWLLERDGDSTFTHATVWPPPGR